MARKCIAMQTKTFEKQRQRKWDIVAQTLVFVA